MEESQPIEKKKNSSPPRGGAPRKNFRRPFEQRLRAVKLYLEEGFPRELIAQETEVSVAAIAKWVRLYRLHGEEGLKDKGNGGPRPRLAEPIRDKIVELKQEEPLAVSNEYRSCLSGFSSCKPAHRRWATHSKNTA